MPLRALLVLSLALSCPVAAFEGRVIDQNGDAVAGADVALLGYAGAARTDRNGGFVWTPDPATPFEVLVVLPNGTYMSSVVVTEIPDGVLTIRVEPLLIEWVTVTSGAAPNIDAPPGSATISVTQEDIEVRHPVTLTDVISNIPGASSLSDLHASVPSLRGLARGRTLLLIDGARVTTERRAGPSATFLDPFFLEGVEVARGPGSVGYGSDAFGGVIHARTRRVAPRSPTKVRLRGALGAGLPEATAGVELTHGLDQGGIVFQARYRNFEEYRSPEGDIFNSQASDKGFLGRFTHALGDGELSVGWQTSFGRDTGRPDSHGEKVKTSYPEENSNRLTLSYDLEPRAGFTRIGFQGFWGRYRLITERDAVSMNNGDDAPKTLSVADVVADDFSFRSFAVRPVGKARWEMGVDINGRYGLEALDSFAAFDRDGDVLFGRDELAIENARRTDIGLYTSTEALVGSRWSIGAGVRVDHVTTNNEGGFFGDQSTENTALSGYGSLKVTFGRGVSLTGQVAHGFRDPTLSDRYFRGITGRGIAIGNPNLEPERANQFDVALRVVSANVRWAVYGYFYRFSDLIERFEVRDDVFLFRNRGRADIRGLEVEAQSELGSNYNVEASAQIARGNTHNDDAPLDDIPGANVKAQLRRNFGERGYAQVRVAYFVEDDRPGPTEIVTPNYGTVDFSAGWRLSSKVELRGLVRNIFDTAFPISPDARAVLAPGVTAVVTVVAEF